LITRHPFAPTALFSLFEMIRVRPRFVSNQLHRFRRKILSKGSGTLPFRTISKIE
jgi:hypothetical protein